MLALRKAAKWFLHFGCCPVSMTSCASFRYPFLSLSLSVASFLCHIVNKWIILTIWFLFFYIYIYRAKKFKRANYWNLFQNIPWFIFEAKTYAINSCPVWRDARAAFSSGSSSASIDLRLTLAGDQGAPRVDCKTHLFIVVDDLNVIYPLDRYTALYPRLFDLASLISFEVWRIYHTTPSNSNLRNPNPHFLNLNKFNLKNKPILISLNS